MIIVGCDYHPGFQQIAFVDTDSGELQERRLQHREEAEKFHRELAAQGAVCASDFAIPDQPRDWLWRRVRHRENLNYDSHICGVS